MNKLWLHVVKKEKGVILVMTALMLPVMFAFVGIAFDIGLLYTQKAKFQNMADAAALAGLVEFKQSEFYKKDSGYLVSTIPIGALEDGSELDGLRANADASADEYLFLNSNDAFFRLGNGGSKVKLYSLRSSDESANGRTYYYEVIVEKTFPLTFARIIHAGDIVVRAGAVSRFEYVVPVITYDYAYAMENWSRLSKEDLKKIDPELRLAVDAEALRNFANHFLHKDSTFLNQEIGTSSPAKQVLFGWYEKETVEYGNLKVQYTPDTSNVVGRTAGEKVVNWLQGDDVATTGYDNTKRYLFSDYAVDHQNGFKLTFTINNNQVTKVRVQVNPRDTANGSGRLDVTVS